MINAYEKCETVVSEMIGYPEKFNYYDVRLKCELPGKGCYDFSKINQFLSLDSVKKEISVGKRNWQDCSDSVYLKLINDEFRSLTPEVETILNHRKKVLTYFGDQDFLCNYLGGLDWSRSLNWAQKNLTQNSELRPFLYKGSAIANYSTND